MKKLAIYIPSIESGGVEKNLYYISEYFLKKEIEVYIITANHKKKILLIKKLNLFVQQIKLGIIVLD